MNLRQKVERTWGVWIFNHAATPQTWEPFDEGFDTKQVAVDELRTSQKKYPDELFALVKSVNTRVDLPTKGAAK